MRALAYVDGFNLYYGALRESKQKWLNVSELCRRLIPKHDLVGVKYFTARVSARAHDKDAPTRQNTFFRALRTLPDAEIHFGHFLVNSTYLPRADGSGSVEVLRTEEKGSDVNLATHLVADGFLGSYEMAIVVSNDSDLAEPIRLVGTKLGLPVWVFAPLLGYRRRPSHVLQQVATQYRSIRRGVLKASQFPDVMNDARGQFRKPAGW